MGIFLTFFLVKSSIRVNLTVQGRQSHVSEIVIRPERQMHTDQYTEPASSPISTHLNHRYGGTSNLYL